MKKQILWGTDLHYNFLKDNELDEFHKMVKDMLENSKKDAAGNDVETIGIVITGDTSEAPKLERHLRMINRAFNLPVYMVCGNHDYWHSSFEKVREKLIELSANSDIKWLGATQYVKLTDQVALVGHDGWYDAVYGDWANSNLYMNDWNYIHEFLGMSIGSVVSFCRATLARQGADHIAAAARSAIANGFKRVVVATHVPPYDNCSLYRGSQGSPTSICWYTNGTLGETLLELAHENPDVDFSVMCGHTHSGVSKRILGNLVVHVGEAEYSNPRFNFVMLDA